MATKLSCEQWRFLLGGDTVTCADIAELFGDAAPQRERRADGTGVDVLIWLPTDRPDVTVAVSMSALGDLVVNTYRQCASSPVVQPGAAYRGSGAATAAVADWLATRSVAAVA